MACRSCASADVPGVFFAAPPSLWFFWGFVLASPWWGLGGFRSSFSSSGPLSSAGVLPPLVIFFLVPGWLLGAFLGSLFSPGGSLFCSGCWFHPPLLFGWRRMWGTAFSPHEGVFIAVLCLLLARPLFDASLERFSWYGHGRCISVGAALRVRVPHMELSLVHKTNRNQEGFRNSRYINKVGA